MSSNTRDRKDAPGLEEQYSVACSTSNLGLPHGEGTGAQGILAAAAWSEVHMGSALRRLRAAWEAGRPKKKSPRPYELLKSAGMTRVQAKRQHNRELVQCALTYNREKRALKLRIPEYAHALDGLMAHAVSLGIEEADTKALAVLDRWLDDPQRQSGDVLETRLLTYVNDCFSLAQTGLRDASRGFTANHPRDCTCPRCCA